MKKIKYKTGDSVYYKDPEGNEWEATIKHTQSWNKEYIITLDVDGVQRNFVGEESLRPSWKKREEKINKILGISSDN